MQPDLDVEAADVGQALGVDDDAATDVGQAVCCITVAYSMMSAKY